MTSFLSNMFDFTLSEMAGEVWDTVGMEILLFLLTVLGFYAFQSEKMQQLFGQSKNKSAAAALNAKKKKLADFDSEDPDALRAVRMEAESKAGQWERALSTWQELEGVTIETFTMAARAMLELRKEAELPEFLQAAIELNCKIQTTSAMNSVLGVVASAHNLNLSKQVHDVFAAVGVASNDVTFERILGGLKEVSPEQAYELASHMKISMSSRVYSLLIKGALKSKRLDRALQFVGAMHQAGHPVPPSCLALILRVAGETGCVKDALKTLPRDIAYPPEALSAILEHAFKSGDMELLKSTHKMAVAEKIELTYTSYDALIKAYASQGDSKAQALFEEMLAKGFDPSEGSVVAMISGCAESRHIQFAEQAAAYSKEKGRASLAMYSALMKVYATSRLYEKTCALYEEIAKEGMELDTVAYGSVIKAAVEGGRLELAQKLFQRSGNPDLLNYMSLIRAAGREKNSKKALALLKELEESAIEVDTTAFNCVLDVCVRSGDAEAARELLERMKAAGHVDAISYNTFLKSFTQQELYAKAEKILEEMRGIGVKPSVVTYNSLINAFISSGDMASAWRYLEDMERSGVAMDKFTCAIMMKGLKHSSDKADVDRILAQMDRAKVVPDEVLVNTVLDACVKLRDPKRLSQALDQFKVSGVVPSMHAYALLIRAYGHAHRLDQAWKVWREIRHDRKASPTEEVYGALIDACVQNDDLDAATKLFVELRTQIPSYSKGTFLFGTLVKVFAQRKELHRALEFYEEMREDPVTCNLVTYNTLIDACARVGDMSTGSRLFRDMCERGVLPDLITYSTVIKGYSVQGDLDQAVQLFTLMRKRGVQPDLILFNSILDCAARKQNRGLAVAEQVLRDMEEAKVAPSNTTLSILVKLYGRAGDMDKCREVVESYPAKYGFEPNTTVCTCLMSTCIANNRLREALGVFKKMQASKGALPDSKAYATIIEGCMKKGQPETAVALVEEALRAGPKVRLEPQTVDAVLLGINRQQKAQELGAPLLAKLRAAGIEPSSRASSSAGRSSAPLLRNPGAQQASGGSSSRFHALREGQPRSLEEKVAVAFRERNSSSA